VVVDPEGPLCDCGKRGCLESYLSDQAILATAQKEVDASIQDLGQLLVLAQAGNHAAAMVLTRAGRLLGQEIANVVNILDPRLILISGEGVRMGDIFFSALRASFKQHVMPGLAEDTEIRVIPWGG